MCNNKLSADKRVCPHSFEFCEIAVGLLLGDGFAERRGTGVRLCLKQSVIHKNYFEQVVLALYQMGYLPHTEYKIQRVVGVKRVYCYFRKDTFTFNSLGWLYDLFYVDNVKFG
jgi:hypothetical protein